MRNYILSIKANTAKTMHKESNSLSVMDKNVSSPDDSSKINKSKPLTNAEKQQRYRDRQKQKGMKEIRGYLTPEALKCYELIAKQTGWSDSVILSNAIRLTYSAYKNGQIGLLNNWLTQHKM